MLTPQLFPHSACWVGLLATSLSSSQQYTQLKFEQAWIRASIQLFAEKRERGKENKILILLCERPLKTTISCRWFRELTFCASDLAILFPVSRARQNRNSLKASSVFPRLTNACPFLRWPCNETHFTGAALDLLSWECAIKPRWNEKRSFHRRET